MSIGHENILHVQFRVFNLRFDHTQYKSTIEHEALLPSQDYYCKQIKIQSSLSVCGQIVVVHQRVGIAYPASTRIPVQD